MSPATKLAGFAGMLVVLFGGGALAGGATDPDRAKPRAAHGDNAGAKSGGGHRAEGGSGAHGDQEASRPVRGLAIAESGLRVVVKDPELRRGQTETLHFRIVDERGRTVRDFDTEHTKRMHLIVARRDLTGFQHLHPQQLRDGSWSVALRLSRAGSYRLFTDFSHDRKAHTLATDLHVDGSADLTPLPVPSPNSVSDRGYDVRLDSGRVRPDQEANLRFTITNDGRPIRTQPYLGAGGHLVALRDGDMAFLHVHPTDDGHNDKNTEAHPDAIGFAATFPTKGSYRLFLQFKHDGRVQTVAFTQEVK